MSNTFRTADRTITITCDEYGSLETIELHGNLSSTRLNAELCRLHTKAMPKYQQHYNNREVNRVMAQLSEPPVPALAGLYAALHDSMATLKQASDDLQSHLSEGENDSIAVTLSGRGCLTSVQCKDAAKKLTAKELGEAIVDAYRKAKSALSSYSDQWSSQLTTKLEDINPVRVNGPKSSIQDMAVDV